MSWTLEFIEKAPTIYLKPSDLKVGDKVYSDFEGVKNRFMTITSVEEIKDKGYFVIMFDVDSKINELEMLPKEKLEVVIE